ncbi:alpha/beta-hydrolase family protein [Actinomycetaceae bacterium L2_0104]
MKPPAILKPYVLPFLPGLTALAFSWLSLMPSLLPRAFYFQGLLTALVALLGYGFGALAGWLLDGMKLPISQSARQWIRRVLLVGGGLITLIMLWLSHRWQSAQRDFVGMEAAPFWHVLAGALIGVLLFAVLLVLSRCLRGLGRFLGRHIGRVLPRRLAAAISVIVVAAITLNVVDNLFLTRFARLMDATYLTINDEFSTDVPAPMQPELSGSADSLQGWGSLGRYGRVFVSDAADPADIAAFTGTEAMQPIRVYVGKNDAEGAGATDELDMSAQADLAIAELERTGAFDREVINVVTSTGRGWINENQAQALEYMWNGNTATVSMQYSYLPSWMSFLVDTDRAEAAGRYLFEAVYARWSELPEDSRPRLVVSGESLGSYGAEGAFVSMQDLTVRTSGALFVGPTAMNHLWNDIVTHRDAGTPMYLPTVDGGTDVRFSADGESWTGSGDWDGPRVGYVQHANDPVKAFSIGLALNRPDWLDSGQRGPGVPSQMHWVPIVTMLQVGVDLFAGDVPEGQGHSFGDAPARAWTHILPPPGWTPEDTDRLVEELARVAGEDLDSLA